MGPPLDNNERRVFSGSETDGEGAGSEGASVTSAQSSATASPPPAPAQATADPHEPRASPKPPLAVPKPPHERARTGKTKRAASDRSRHHPPTAASPKGQRLQQQQQRGEVEGNGQRRSCSTSGGSHTVVRSLDGQRSLSPPVVEASAVHAGNADAAGKVESRREWQAQASARNAPPASTTQQQKRHKHAKPHRRPKQRAAGIMHPSTVKLAMPSTLAAAAKRTGSSSRIITTYKNSTSGLLSALSSSPSASSSNRSSSYTAKAAAASPFVSSHPITKAAQPSFPKRLSSSYSSSSSSTTRFGSTNTIGSPTSSNNNQLVRANHSFNYLASNNKQQREHQQFKTQNSLASTNQHAIKDTTSAAGHTQHKIHQANHQPQRHQHINSSSVTNINNSNNNNRYISLPLQQQQQRENYLPSTKTTLRQKSLYHSTHHQTNLKSINMADQAVIDKLEAGFAKLQAATPEQCHSLLKKYLSREVLDQLKSRKTAMGATLLDVAQSGFENLDSGVGIYAPDAESYTLFKELFNPIIEDYHGGFKATDKHPASDFGDLESLVNVDPNNEYVISTRVRCGRSLQGYPFNPCLTEAQYKEMEAKVSSTLKEMQGDLAGTYYPLTGMTKETQQQLIDDHFLFKEGDRFLQAANACRYWPTGRGIYHNVDKTFLVWVNEEDHLRIISMQKGGDLKTIFSRMVRGVRSIEAKVPFSRDERLGFLTFCPTNLGTTIRASVHIKLPKLAADRKKLEEVAGKFNLQVRGTSGEHTESIGGVYDISNKRRLGLTEYQAVREMQDGILELIKIEKSL